jgi:hypothetical protein
MDSADAPRLAYDLAQRTLNGITEPLGLVEKHSAEGEPYQTLVGQMGPAPVGSIRIFERNPSGPEIRVVYVSLVVPAFGLDSHMLYAFADPASLTPHFTLDSVGSADGQAFHLDFTPRVELSTNIAYVDHCFVPVTDAWEQAQAIPGMELAKLKRRQWSVMSPWMLANRATSEAFLALGAVVDAYRNHWLSMVTEGVPAATAPTMTPQAIADRDARLRANIFSPDVDPVWALVDRLIGQQGSGRIQELLRDAHAAL